MPDAPIRLALADDHVIVRKGFRDIIASFGEFEVVIEADHGDELLRQLQTTPVDICILDIGMPKKDGYQTTLELRKQYPDMKVLVLSMYNNEFAILRMLRAGANGYLPKNCHPNDLKAALHDVYLRGFYHSDFVTSRVFKTLQNERNKLPDFTARELQFLGLCCSDLNYKHIAEEMGCSTRTIENYRDSLFDKLNVRTRTALALYGLQMGLVSFYEDIRLS